MKGGGLAKEGKKCVFKGAPDKKYKKASYGSFRV